MEYPRILLLHNTKIHADDPENLLIRNLFGKWPKDKLAQIYSGCYPGSGEFCDQYYAIGSKERRFGRFFNLLKPVGVAAVSGQSISEKTASLRSTLFKVLVKKIGSLIIDSGVWEVVFRIRRSEGLVKFVHEFRPDIIYTQGYSLGLTRLTLELSEFFHVPICYFPVDDWHSSLYRKSPVHREVVKLAFNIAKLSSLRFSLGPKMAEILTRRYQVNFECIYNADKFSRFEAVTYKLPTNPKIIFGLVGSLYLGREMCLLDLLNACESIDIEFKIQVYCTSVPVGIPEKLLNNENIEFLSLPSHVDLPQSLANCDVLFLPESFNLAFKSAIELSLSTKCHLYMMSCRPILVYGPEWSGTVNYAKRFGWGVVVDTRNNQAIVDGIIKCLSDELSKRSICKGLAVARQNHDVDALGKYVLERFTSTIFGYSS